MQLRGQNLLTHFTTLLHVAQSSEMPQKFPSIFQPRPFLSVGHSGSAGQEISGKSKNKFYSIPSSQSL